MKKTSKLRKGKGFGRLTVLQVINKPEHQGEFYLCQCSCGDISTYSREYLEDTAHEFKGCKDCEKTYDQKVGKVFGDYKVLSVFTDSQHKKHYNCVCTTCGATRTYLGLNLSKISKCRKHIASYCTVSSDTTKMTIQSKDGPIEVLIDTEDLEEVKKHVWDAYLNGNGHCVALTTVDGKSVSLSKFILQLHNLYAENDNLQILCFNKNTLDCRKENLTQTTYTNQASYRKTPKNNTSGRKGVYYFKANVTKPWEAKLTFNRKTYFLGRYSTFEEAVKAREQGEAKLLKFVYDEETGGRKE